MNNKDKVLRLFFDSPTKKFHVREIARITKLNPNTIINILNTFEKENLVIKVKKKHIVEVSANINDKFKTRKRLDNIFRLYDVKIIDFLEKEFFPESISVVGSYSFGEDIEKSDIDIVVISKEEKELDMPKFERLLSRKIHLITTNLKSMSDEFYINLINGVLLYGYLDKK